LLVALAASSDGDRLAVRGRVMWAARRRRRQRWDRPIRNLTAEMTNADA